MTMHAQLLFTQALRAIGIVPPSPEALPAFLAGREATLQAPTSREARQWRERVYGPNPELAAGSLEG